MGHGMKNLTGRRAVLGWLITGLAGMGAPALALDKFIVMASTTSTEQSGLFTHLLPAFKRASGIEVRVVAVGTGQALDMGRRGVLLAPQVGQMPASLPPEVRHIAYAPFSAVLPLSW